MVDMPENQTWMLANHPEKKIDENYTSYFKQIQETRPLKIADVQPPITHLSNFPSKSRKTCGA